MPRRPVRALVPLVLVAALGLTGCSQVESAVNSAQSAFASATGAAGALVAACSASENSLVDQESGEQAKQTLQDAVTKVDEALAGVPDLPGVAEIKQAVSNARAALESADGVKVEEARQQLKQACASITG